MSDFVFARRAFLGAGAATAASTAASYARILGANERILLGVIGAGDRARHVMSLFQTHAAVEVAALCDVYADQIDRAKAKAPAARTFRDHRRLLEVKELNAVLVGTPDHWHAAITIDARRGARSAAKRPATGRHK